MKSDISGFPEFLPNEQIVFAEMMDLIKHNFELYGFIPMDTPAVERVSTLLSKGDDNEIYGLYRLADEKSKKELGLRFDLTVPLARYVASKFGDLIFPYRRYQIGPVWRGERSQLGRYRQFYQCDIDILGDGHLSLEHDAEIIKVLTETLRQLPLPMFTTRINNRKILQYFLCTLIPSEDVSNLVRLIDKKSKITHEEFLKALAVFGLSRKNIDILETFLNAKNLKTNTEVLHWLRILNIGPGFSEGVEELESTINLLKKFGIEDNDVKISLELARGLTYYTGNVFETTFDAISGIGSIAAGGRYDNLVSTMSGKKVPGVGASIGLTRLIARLLDRNLIKCERSSVAELLVTTQNRNFISSYMRLSNKFRELGIKTETYLQDKPLGHQLSYASRKGIQHVLIANDVELLENVAILRNLYTKEQISIGTKDMGQEILTLIRRE